jgi:DSF synthase
MCLDAAVAPPKRLESVGQFPESPATQEYRYIRTESDLPRGTVWCELREDAPLWFNRETLEELRLIQNRTRLAVETADAVHEVPTKFQVLCSAIPDVFSYGGDLRLFASLIRAGDRCGLEAYANLATQVVYNSAISRTLGVTTVCVIEGTAFGGGFEAALSGSVLIAERGTEFGFPEIRFNMFPGMGAYQLLTRRVSAYKAEEMIMSGAVYTAETLHEMGVVDMLAEPGKGWQIAADYIRKSSAQSRGYEAFSKVVDISKHLNKDEFMRVAQIWVDAAFNLEERDLKIMDFLARVQDKKMPAAMN